MTNSNGVRAVVRVIDSGRYAAEIFLRVIRSGPCTLGRTYENSCEISATNTPTCTSIEDDFTVTRVRCVGSRLLVETKGSSSANQRVESRNDRVSSSFESRRVSVKNFLACPAGHISRFGRFQKKKKKGDPENGILSSPSRREYPH